MGREMDRPRELRSSLEVVYREHDARRDGILARRLIGQFPQGLDLDIAPLAAGFASPDKPVELRLYVPAKAPSSPFATARRQKCGTLRMVPPNPAQELRAFPVGGQPVEAEFDCGRLAQGQTDARRHLHGSCRRYHPADAPHTLPELAVRHVERRPLLLLAGLKPGAYIWLSHSIEN